MANVTDFACSSQMMIAATPGQFVDISNSFTRRVTFPPKLIFMDRDDEIPASDLEIHESTVQEKIFYDVQFTEDNIRRHCKFSGLCDRLKEHFYFYVLDPRRKLKLKAPKYWSSDFPDAAAIHAFFRTWGVDGGSIRKVTRPIVCGLQFQLATWIKYKYVVMLLKQITEAGELTESPDVLLREVHIVEDKFLHLCLVDLQIRCGDFIVPIHEINCLILRFNSD
jgi:hypothetical protein